MNANHTYMTTRCKVLSKGDVENLKGGMALKAFFTENGEEPKSAELSKLMRADKDGYLSTALDALNFYRSAYDMPALTALPKSA